MLPVQPPPPTSAKVAAQAKPRASNTLLAHPGPNQPAPSLMPPHQMVTDATSNSSAAHPFTLVVTVVVTSTPPSAMQRTNPSAPAIAKVLHTSNCIPRQLCTYLAGFTHVDISFQHAMTAPPQSRKQGRSQLHSGPLSVEGTTAMYPTANATMWTDKALSNYPTSQVTGGS